MLRITFKLLHTFRIDKVEMVIGRDIISFNSIITRRFVAHKKNILKPEDKFGTLSSEKNFIFYEDESNDKPKGEHFGKLDILKKIKASLDAHEYDKALELLRNVQKTERAPVYAYNLLISYNGKLGNIEEAFKLYNDLKKRGHIANKAMYTSLFNACANCQRSDIALPIAYKLTRYLFESKNLKPNMTNYHAMLKAFGRLGDISASFQLVDRLCKTKSKITTDTYNILLQACIADKASGLRFALSVWHHMLKRNIKPDEYTFRNMAKCAQSCSMGDVALILDFVKMIVGKDKIKETEKPNQELESILELSAESRRIHMLGDGENVEMEPVESSYFPKGIVDRLDEGRFEIDAKSEHESLENLTASCKLNSNKLSHTEKRNQTEHFQSSHNVHLSNGFNIAAFEEMELPNLLDPTPTWGSAIDFVDFSTPENRFMLYGGLRGFFKVVDHFNVKPDIKLFNILVYCIPPTTQGEQELLEFKEKYKIKSDIRFMNVLLRRRKFLEKGYTFQDCVDCINKLGVSPDVDTMRVLAESSVTREEGIKCIELSRSYKIRFSDRFIYALVKNAVDNCDLDFLSDILAAVKEEELQLPPKALAMIGSIVKEAKLKELVENIAV